MKNSIHRSFVVVVVVRTLVVVVGSNHLVEDLAGSNHLVVEDLVDIRKTKS